MQVIVKNQVNQLRQVAVSCPHQTVKEDTARIAVQMPAWIQAQTRVMMTSQTTVMRKGQMQAWIPGTRMDQMTVQSQKKRKAC